LACAVVALAGFSASAQKIQGRYQLNLDRIFEANSAKSAQTKLEQIQQARKEVTDSAAQALESCFQTNSSASSHIGSSQYSPAPAWPRTKIREFQRKRREFQEDLNTSKNEELQQVIERANR
jgi:outer membrane protein